MRRKRRRIISRPDTSPCSQRHPQGFKHRMISPVLKRNLFYSCNRSTKCTFTYYILAINPLNVRFYITRYPVIQEMFKVLYTIPTRISTSARCQLTSKHKCASLNRWIFCSGFLDCSIKRRIYLASNLIEFSGIVGKLSFL